jgi:glycosyltransferase involved in cell wall biosynthesis
MTSDLAAPLVTVLMTARDASDYIAAAVDSIRAQTVEDWELLVVDDASADDTPRIVEDYAAADPRVRLVRRSVSGGPYVAANHGLQESRGTYLARLDADDISLRDRLERQLRFLRQRPGLRGCMGEIQVMAGDRLLRFGKRVIPTLPRAVKWGLATRAFFPSTALLETAAVRDVGGYRELEASQDHRLWCDLARREWLGVLPEVLAYWRRHERQLSDRKYELQQSLGSEVVAEHLSELSGSMWTTRAAHVLRSIGASQPIPLREGLAVLKRYERAWRADVTLSADERHELERLTSRLRSDHVREAARKAITSRGPGRSALELYTRVNLKMRRR